MGNEMISESEGGVLSKISENPLQRFHVSLPRTQNEALNSWAEATGLSKNELLRQAVALLGSAIAGKKRGLKLALTDQDNGVVAHLITTLDH